ncbi:MAG: biotin--[acetyl-CoA-carboxylase] ligase, partial [Cyanobacteriota bacterium]|nr:biotin--[acetyl-CoA-carboxylase] ligase [Cyanobacteriota bacterium]
DLIVGSRKLAGVLPKLVFRGHHVRLARIGVGLNVCNPVPQGGIALRELLPPGRCQVRLWQLHTLLALERANQLAAHPQRVVAAAEQRLWCRSVADPASGEHWAVCGIGLDGQLLLRQGTRTTSWTRWGGRSDGNL